MRPAPATKISYFFEILFSHYFASDITPNKDDCIWFFEKGLGIANKHENNQGNNQTVLPLLEYISPHYYGFYLSWILGSNKDEYGDIFGLFKSETRKYLGEVLNSSSVAGSVSLMTIVGNDTLVNNLSKSAHDQIKLFLALATSSICKDSFGEA